MKYFLTRIIRFTASTFSDMGLFGFYVLSKVGEAECFQLFGTFIESVSSLSAICTDFLCFYLHLLFHSWSF